LRERLGERGINISSKFIARKFRSNFTDAELKLLSALKNRQLQNFKFRRQASIGKYIVGFVCLEKSLITEVDGGQHMEASLADDERTAWLQSQGCRVIRFWNDQILKETDAVLEETLRCLSQGNQR
jgi:very-short-patch-repair endonuclease